MIVKVQLLIPGCRLEENVFMGKTLILKAGTIVTDRHISKLKQFQVDQVRIKSDEAEDGVQQQHDVSQTNTYIDPVKIKKMFFEAVTWDVSEKRYGKIFHNLDDFEQVESHFVSIVSHTHVYQWLMDLKAWDNYSYYHSIDVFILFTMLSRKYGWNQQDMDTATGVLLHDIGKLQVPQAILRKKTKLSSIEYILVQKHTLHGYEMLKEVFVSEKTAQIARSHHERLDGSGYPDQLAGSKLDESLKMVMICDVYSALTLERSYKQPVDANDALIFMLRSEGKFDMQYLNTFIETLGIYPKGAIVELSNKKEAEILKVKNYMPILSSVRLLDSNAVYELPTDYTLSVDKLLQWDPEYKIRKIFQKHWHRFKEHLVNGEKKEALFYLDVLSDGMRIEDIYTHIYAPTLKEIGEDWKNEVLTVADEHVATLTMEEVMDEKFYDFNSPIHHNRPKIVVGTVGNERHVMPLKMISHLLTINGWKTFNLVHPLPKEDLQSFIKEHAIAHIILAITMEENIDPLQQLVHWLNHQNPHLNIIVGGHALTGIQIESAHLQISDMIQLIYHLESLKNPIKEVN